MVRDTHIMLFKVPIMLYYYYAPIPNTKKIIIILYALDFSQFFHHILICNNSFGNLYFMIALFHRSRNDKLRPYLETMLLTKC